MANFVDQNGIEDFIDEDGITVFIDQDGVFLGLGGTPELVTVTGTMTITGQTVRYTQILTPV